MLLALVSAATAHLHLEYPPTLKGDNNPHTQGQPDNYLNYPFGCCAQPKEKSQVCKGHLGLIDTDEGKPTAVWAAGQSANFSLSGHKIQNTKENPEGNNHGGGGSCQVGFSTDKGETFKVVKTWQGNCPPHDVESAEPADMTLDFNVPADLPTGDVIFAWTWVNRKNLHAFRNSICNVLTSIIGEQEFNMNCAAVTITGGNGETPEVPPSSVSTAPATTPTQTQPPNYEGPNTTPDQYTLEGCKYTAIHSPSDVELLRLHRKWSVLVCAIQRPWKMES